MLRGIFQLVQNMVITYHYLVFCSALVYLKTREKKRQVTLETVKEYECILIKSKCDPYVCSQKICWAS